MMGEELMLDMLKGVKVASIGPITSQSCRELGLKVDIEAESFTLDSLTEAIEAHFS
jgi:uroporphyrinogen III methyltransferase/synthase